MAEADYFDGNVKGNGDERVEDDDVTPENEQPGNHLRDPLGAILLFPLVTFLRQRFIPRQVNLRSRIEKSKFSVKEIIGKLFSSHIK